MAGILNLALPYFGLIFIGFACGKTRGLPESGLAWMNFFLLYVSLPALLFGIMSATPFEQLNNPPFLIATSIASASAFVLALFVGRLLEACECRRALWLAFREPSEISATWDRVWHSLSSGLPPRRRLR